MQNLFGRTRTVVERNYALIAEDGHVPSTFPNWIGCTAYVLISPAMGANLSQILMKYDDPEGGTVKFSADTHEHVFYIQSGEVTVEWEDTTQTLQAEDFLFIPSQTAFTLKGTFDTTLTLFRKVYEPLESVEEPPVIWGSSNDVPSVAFMGNERAQLRTLLPTDDRFDLAMNIFVYQPGATLPFVETHIMEHGWLMLAGQGLNRLGEIYYPVKAGDVIWMGAYCPQWFVAMGDEPASYLYYKNVNRLP